MKPAKFLLKADFKDFFPIDSKGNVRSVHTAEDRIGF